MPTKTTKFGRDYEVTGKKFIWHPLDDNDESGNLPDITIPLRIKLGLILDLGDEGDFNNTAMAQILESLIPDQMDRLRDMDVNDFQEMFATWQREYNTLTGASLGE